MLLYVYNIKKITTVGCSVWQDNVNGGCVMPHTVIKHYTTHRNKPTQQNNILKNISYKLHTVNGYISRFKKNYSLTCFANVREIRPINKRAARYFI